MSYLKLRDIPQHLEQRIAEARKNKELEPNCYGTAFFLLGVLPYDMVVFTDRETITEALAGMDCSETPRDMSIMLSLRDTALMHASFIKQAVPLQGYQREGSSGEFREVHSMKEVRRYLESLESPFKCFSQKAIVYTSTWYTLKSEHALDAWARKQVARYTPGWDG
ncbi:hypothetical protein HYZ97_03865 [Candidatus Pacearchaeota archaeon]|nr:hypothetical protein [Candidatus Pacearchaeota archaeon]